jgi:hypothetical protein
LVQEVERVGRGIDIFMRSAILKQGT